MNPYLELKVFFNLFIPLWRSLMFAMQIRTDILLLIGCFCWEQVLAHYWISFCRLSKLCWKTLCGLVSAQTIQLFCPLIACEVYRCRGKKKKKKKKKPEYGFERIFKMMMNFKKFLQRRHFERRIPSKGFRIQEMRAHLLNAKSF